MAFFRVGMRVKKVRGEKNIGIVGIVIGTNRITKGDHNPFAGRPANLSEGFVSDLQVQVETHWMNHNGDLCPPEKPAFTKAENWEPIINKQEPCDAEFKQSLDQLLARTKQDA